MKKTLHLFTALLAMCTAMANAHDFENNGIYYKVTDAASKTVEVTYKGNTFNEFNEYVGNVVIPEKVSNNDIIYVVGSIGETAFSGCTGLTGVTIPNSVTSIGNGAFDDCIALTGIVIPGGVTNIGEWAFASCSGIESIVVDNNSVFDSRNNCNAIIEKATNKLVLGCKNTVIPSDVTTIGAASFDGCTGLTEITIPNSVTTIEHDAFCGCNALKSIIIPNSVTSIDAKAFFECSSLERITLSQNITSIAAHTFFNCTSLKGIVIPSGMTSIGNDAFVSCESLKTVANYSTLDITARKTTHGNVALYADEVTKPFQPHTEIDGIYYNIIDEIEKSVEVTFMGSAPEEHNEYTGNVTIPENISYNGTTYTVYRIGETAFSGCTELTGVTIPNSVTSIGNGAFLGCIALTGIVIPSGVTSIGEWAFASCSGIENIVVDNNNSVFDSRNNCNAIIEKATNKLILGCKSTVIPSDVTTIGAASFDGCTGLTEITIPNSVTTIEHDAFSSCSTLKNIVIPNSVTSIDAKAFFECSSLESITLSENITCIATHTFFNCTSLKGIVIPSGVTSIENEAFTFCESLKTVTNYSTLDITAKTAVHGKVALYADNVLSPRITDGKEFVYDNIKDFSTIYYKRNFNNTDWQGWYMPFEVKLEDIENELEVAYLNDARQYDDNQDGEIDRTELEVIPLVNGTLSANYPYIVRAKTTGEKNFIFKGVTVEPFEENSIDCSSVTTKFTFTGTHTAISNEEMNTNGYYALCNNALVAPAKKIPTSPAELSNDHVYTIRCERTFLLYSSNTAVNNKLCTGNGKEVGNVARDVNDVNQQFKIININDSYYLYSVGAGKYVNKEGVYTDTATDAITFKKVEGEYPWQLSIGGNVMNSQDPNQLNEGIVLDDWDSADNGNCYLIEAVTSDLSANRWYLQIESRNPLFKAPARINLFVVGNNNNGDDNTTTIDEIENEDAEVKDIYDLAGRKIESPTKGIYIIGGKKVLVK